jgi:hypothetical protein
MCIALVAQADSDSEGWWRGAGPAADPAPLAAMASQARASTWISLKPRSAAKQPFKLSETAARAAKRQADLEVREFRRARGGSSDNSALRVQAVIQTWSSNFAAVSDFKFASRHFLPLHHPAAARLRQYCLETFLPLIEVWFHVSVSHWVSLYYIFTLNPVGIPAMCSAGIPVVSKL